MERFEHGGDVWAHPGCVDFSASLNPLGMPSAARAVLRDRADAYETYPDPACRALTAAIAAYEGVPLAQVLACAGATDAFARICQVLRPRRALLCAPGYVGYEQALAQVGSSVQYHALCQQQGFAPSESLANDIAAGIDLVFLANPNNPTGLCIDRSLIEACLERAREVGATVVLDECFVDLTEHGGSTDLVASRRNLILVKAFTKAFALAGLRLGYVLCGDADLLARLRDAGQPWAVSTPAQLAGVACLADAGSYLARSRSLIARERGRLVKALGARGARVVEGQANYLLFQARSGLGPTLLERGLLVRSCANFAGLDDTWYRVAVRAPHENDLLIAALEEVL